MTRFVRLRRTWHPDCFLSPDGPETISLLAVMPRQRSLAVLGVPDGLGGGERRGGEFGAADEEVGHPGVWLVVDKR